MKKRTRWRCRQLLTTTLAIGGTLSLVVPVLANGTAAGTTISNTATATYQDPNDPATTLNATSNTVVVQVAEVAGISMTPLAITDTDPTDPVLPGDILHYDFRLTNVGNDPTQFIIPGVATVGGPGTAGTLIADLNGDGIYETTIPAAGFTTGLIAPGQSVSVRVPVTVTALASSGSTISVLLGNTGANDNSANTQNQPDGTAPNGNDVKTLDGTAGNTVIFNGVTYTESTGAPVNGEREASAIQQVLVGSQPQAFATVLKTRTGYTDNATPAILSDDTLTYALALRVESLAPNGSSGLTPANLVGTTVNGIGANRVLVSDAIPANTVLTGTPVAPVGWTVVYTTNPLTTTANNATWTVAQPPSGVTRVGFVYDASTTPIVAGTTVSGFSFTVTTSGVTTTTTIANIAQAFGQTQNGGTTLVYDESGDQSPSNFNDNGTPGSNIPTDGVADPLTQGIDNNNNNTGIGPGGEDFVFTIASPGAILSGPNGQPAAVGPTDNNDDFTNKSTPIPLNTAPNSLIDPAPTTFSNTINNPSTSATLTNVLLVPDTFNFTATTGEVLPPTGTTVTLIYGNQSATYTFDGTNFIFTSGSAITIPSLAPGASVNYNVTVDLPNNTPLSTDTSQGFSIPLYAFVDGSGSTSAGRPDAGDTTLNSTIDRVYTGFLKLIKDARVLDSNGAVVLDYPATPGTTNIPTALIQPGRFIEYRITYTNISIAPVGAGNITLNAGNVVITENGTIAPNNWAIDQDANGVIDTSNVVTSATATYGSITYSPSGDQSGNTQATDVTQYVNSVGISIQPGASGTFTFRRRIN
ncbi:MAG: hypothetical protein KME16_08310 [Scytolyngbya sp. HA4215-MV1]|jgi:hypothetical protein|nr:hypothetical protein [Scytolyngbya sp. HA4215-MV1]